MFRCERDFTMHGKDLSDIKANLEINKLIEAKLIEKIIFLGGVKNEYNKIHYANFVMVSNES